MHLFKRLEITSLGKWFVVLTIILGITAVNTGNNLLYLIVSMLLSLIIVSGILSETTLRGIKIHRKTPIHLFAKRPNTFTWTIENRKGWIPSFALWIEEADNSVASPIYVTKVPPASYHPEKIDYTFGRRGIYRLEGFRISTRFPFGLFLKTRYVPEEAELTVYPHIKLKGQRYLKGGGLREEVVKGMRGSGKELYSIRDYLIGEDSRFIHWKSSAKVSRLLVKELEREEGKRVIVFLDNSIPENPPDNLDIRFEEIVEEVATLVFYLLKSNCSVGFRHLEGKIPIKKGMNHLYAILKELAIIKINRGRSKHIPPFKSKARVVHFRI